MLISQKLLVVGFAIIVSCLIIGVLWGNKEAMARGKLSSKGIIFSKVSYKEAQERGKRDIMKLFQQAGVLGDKPDRWLSTLSWSIIHNNIRLLQQELENGANIELEESVFYSPMTPLMVASYLNNIDALDVLLKANVDINHAITINENVTTALTIACMRSNMTITQKLIDRGADVNLGWPVPLAWAVALGDKEFILYIINSGADVNASKRGDLEVEDSLYQAPLYFACYHDDSSMLELLGEKGADYKGSKGGFLLATAISDVDDRKKDLLEIVSFLLANGADIDGRDRYGRTALMVAADRNKIEIVELLLSKGADLTLKDRHNNDVFSYAKQFAKDGIRNLLLDNQGQNGVTH